MQDIKQQENINEAYVRNHGYVKCPHCEKYIHEIVSLAVEQSKKEVLKEIFTKMDEYEFYKDQVHCSCLEALREHLLSTNKE